jgi:hypothetical protein
MMRPVRALLLTPVAALVRCTDFGELPSQPRPAPPVASVVILSPGSGSIETQVGRSVDFTAEARDANGNPIASAAVDWASADVDVATVVVTGTRTGRAVGIGEGTTEIRATSGSVDSAPIELRVRPATQVPGSITITSPASPADVLVGGTVQFVAAVLDTNSAPIAGAVVTWSSGDSSIASIDQSGLASGKAAGETPITASIDTLTSSPVLLRVQQPAPDFTTDVQPIFNGNCAFSNCHGFSAGLTLTPSVSYSRLVNVRSTQSSLFRVAPGDPDNSFLYIKIAGCPGPRCVGTRMPSGRPPLAEVHIQTIRDWIAAGALP